MKMVIIADDMTGACDTGVQMAVAGMNTSVLFAMNADAAREWDVIAINTDSRTAPPEEAHRKVEEACLFLRNFAIDLVFKKMDSTLRGNIGAEMDAAYDAFQADLAILAPAYPDNGRTIRDGYLYLNGKRIDQTEFANDPMTPVKESSLPRLLAGQSSKPAALITLNELRRGPSPVASHLEELHRSGTAFVVFDSENMTDLHKIVDAVNLTKLRVIWGGSAGLAQALTRSELKPRENILMPPISASNKGSPVLTVVGSINGRTRHQLKELMRQPGTFGIVLRADKLLDRDAEHEIATAYDRAVNAFSQGLDVVIYSSTDNEDVQHALTAGASLGLDAAAIGDRIADRLGEAASRLVQDLGWGGLVLTGGDTAGRVFTKLGAQYLLLENEVETGVPVGRMAGVKPLRVVTKAGNFGSDSVLIRAIHWLKGADA